METERNQQRNQDGRTDGVRDGDSAAKRMEEGRLYFPGDEDILKEQMECMEHQPSGADVWLHWPGLLY